MKAGLTITGDGRSLSELEAIGTFPGGDLAMRELGKELWLQIIHKVLVVLRDSDLDASDCSSGKNLISSVNEQMS